MQIFCSARSIAHGYYYLHRFFSTLHSNPSIPHLCQFIVDISRFIVIITFLTIIHPTCFLKKFIYFGDIWPCWLHLFSFLVATLEHTLQVQYVLFSVTHSGHHSHSPGTLIFCLVTIYSLLIVFLCLMSISYNLCPSPIFNIMIIITFCISYYFQLSLIPLLGFYIPSLPVILLIWITLPLPSWIFILDCSHYISNRLEYPHQILAKLPSYKSFCMSAWLSYGK